MKKESVWDYPRPPALKPFSGHLRIIHRGRIIADTHRAYRVLETSHPPTYYIPPEDVKMELLSNNHRQTWCEWKGRASYYDLISGSRIIPSVAWYYADPKPAFLPIRNYLSFYASRVDQCLVNDEVVQAQEGDFYGGWITSNIQGPFKGGKGTWGW